MKTNKWRTIVPVGIAAVVGIAYAAHASVGTPSGFGWGDVSLLCPLGALGTMLAAKTTIPRAVVALVAAVVLIVLFGRAFCAWACPVPVSRRLGRVLFGRKGGDKPKAGIASAVDEPAPADAPAAAKLTEEEAAAIAEQSSKLVGKTGCAACSKIDTRHFVLGGALLSAAIFGFPVFCLICPIGLAFGTLFLVIGMFSGDMTWGILILPALLVLELTVFRKWCGKVCPIGALMGLIARIDKRTLRPTVNAGKCIEKDGVKCGRCAKACEAGINPRHPERGLDYNECTKCHACVEACPGRAITMPLRAPKAEVVAKPVSAPAAKGK